MDYIQIKNEGYYKITNSDGLRPFFMSIVSDSNHWMFISSNGGLTAGRKNSNYALFPYYTDDKITESYEITGSKSIFVVNVDGEKRVWEPFSDRYTGVFTFTRNLYKNEYGNKIIFEEINHDLGLTYQCHWNSSNKYGFVKRSKLINNTETAIEINLLDGLQNIMPYGVEPVSQQVASNLVDAYKKSELLSRSGLGIFTLSAIIVDKAEPSEALKANIVWSKGLEHSKVLLSSLQLDTFRKSGTIVQEEDIRAEKGAYFVVSHIELTPKAEKEWVLVADVNKGPSDVVRIAETIIKEKQLIDAIYEDIEIGTQNLLTLTMAADGKQLTADKRKNTRHYANVLFNMMRGGIFDDNYNVEKRDFKKYLKKANIKVFDRVDDLLRKLPEVFDRKELSNIAWHSIDKDFSRLCFEYLPLKFSRRHGDPSRPWNKFSINTHSEVDGSKILDYEGNWRDIFQNWEALAHSYPDFIENMIHKFLNATTFDGYNPYRVTKGGYDWEVIEPDDPWSYIGYWGDHQIIYLLKFLEFIEKHQPNKLAAYFNEDFFVYANVPYIIKDYDSILKNPKDTIDFNHALDAQLRVNRNEIGADGALWTAGAQGVYKVNLIEKLLATLLAKCSNFIPEAGIWLTTQRPEWNDANNALVGNGVSMVTLYYMRRFLTFLEDVLINSSMETVKISSELLEFFNSTLQTLKTYQELLSNNFSDKDRKKVMDGLGLSASNYRNTIYQKGFSGQKKAVNKKDIQVFAELFLQYIDHAIKANKRSDKLYHAYNLMTLENNEEVSISYLNEMLEGQVAVLSSGYLTSGEALEVLDALKASKLFREDQYSYLLYPNKELPRFTERNNIPAEEVQKSKLLRALLKEDNREIIEQDIKGDFHFNGNFNNAASLNEALNGLGRAHQDLVGKEKELLLQTFEKVFNHKAFTGRSGTFYGYEGLGSIYWHMVSKLLLAVQECCIKAIDEQVSEEVIGRLKEHYYEINAGIGVHKSPELYGAFPTDPYSHTPGGKGAQQPGMTGQVKEDILTRFGELGVFAEKGQLFFAPTLLLLKEFLDSSVKMEYIGLNGQHEHIVIKRDQLGFTYCQVPIVYELSDENSTIVHLSDGDDIRIESLELSRDLSVSLFARDGTIKRIHVYLKR
ncbi:hypothetical protein BFP77_05695 [Maribacter sp. 4U21]|uniref:hypothetical protein n=1 Tax=Maribacter sp. 4U21 TaxID=1889779 RepID=UPI000C151D27|nr:hypothetical protein [Maribacter sp. 4U21]PIB29642.1 hypothetical protein BFP77_05695 [Maribacter sp. 4U21]